jgi:hypothetical protein
MMQRASRYGVVFALVGLLSVIAGVRAADDGPSGFNLPSSGGGGFDNALARPGGGGFDVQAALGNPDAANAGSVISPLR